MSAEQNTATTALAIDWPRRLCLGAQCHSRQASKVSNLLVGAAITADIRYRERSETHSARTDGSLTAQPDVMKNRG